jgi:hypothetical protein
MLNNNCVPNLPNKLFQKLEVKLAYLSEIMVLGRPCNMKSFFIKNLSSQREVVGAFVSPNGPNLHQFPWEHYSSNT